MTLSIRPSAHLCRSVVLTMAIALASIGTAGAVPSRHQAGGPIYGGTLRIAYSSDMATLDPAQAVAEDWYPINDELFNGLYQFDRAGRPQLDLAAAPPTISADRTVWTFRLRAGVLFHNGMELTADDVKFSLMRVLDPHLKPAASWGQTSDAPLFRGGQAFVAGKATDVSGIQVLGRYSIRFALVRPVAIFPSILASSYNFIVPKAVVTKESADSFASHPIGTGPFKLVSWQKGSQLTFARNPHYFHANRPYLDGVILYTNLTSSIIALKVEHGDIDGVGAVTDLGAADIQGARTDPRYAPYLVEAPPTFGAWLDLNTQAGPLANPLLRQAVAMAIDRRRLIRLLGGNATPAAQLYIPLDTQHDLSLQQHPSYPHDPQRAAALVKASGYHGQPLVFLYMNDYAVATSMAPGIQQELQQIGLSVTLRGVSTTTLNSLIGSKTGHDINFGYWGVDFPDAYDVYAGVMSCAPNAPGGLSGAHYCDPAADSLVNTAETLPLGASRDALLRQAQIRILRSAAKVPLVFPKSIVMASPKVGGFYFEPLFGWQVENYWLKK